MDLAVSELATGEPVTIRYDPRDLAEIRVYHHDEFLCRAVSPEIATVTVSMQDLQAARNQRRRELRQTLTARRSLVELLTQPHPPTLARTARPPARADLAPAAQAVPRGLTRAHACSARPFELPPQMMRVRGSLLEVSGIARRTVAS